MTANELFTLALSFLSEKPPGSVQEYAIGWLNILLSECLKYENAIRRSRGEEELEKAPLLQNFEEEIPYCDEILMSALPYGLASFFYVDDENDFRAENNRARYISALDDLTILSPVPIEDVYGGEDSA